MNRSELHAASHALVLPIIALLLFAVVTCVGGAHAASSKRDGQPGWHLWGPGSDWRREWQTENMTPRHRRRMQRHWIFMNGNIPAYYQNLKNPYMNVDTATGTGQQLYTKHCARCHGDEGFGEGAAGLDLNPSPALLAFLVQMPIAVDSYLMWSIAEGGVALNSDMPAFKDNLSQDQIWQIITYIRTGFAPP